METRSRTQRFTATATLAAGTLPARATVFAIALAVMLLAVTSAGAYVVVLKDGTQIITSVQYELDGDRVLLTMRNGTKTFYPAADVDFEETDRINADSGLGGAKFIEDRIQKIDTDEAIPDDPDTLSDVVGGRGLSLPAHSKREVRTVPGAEALPTTKAGFIDLTKVDREPLDDAEVNQEILSYLAGQGHDRVGVFQGVVASQPLLELRANTESEVFKGIRDVASALVQMVQRFPERVLAFDLLLLSDQKIRGGQFTMTPEQAQLLVSGRIEPQLYFLRYVEF